MESRNFPPLKHVFRVFRVARLLEKVFWVINKSWRFITKIQSSAHGMIRISFEYYVLLLTTSIEGGLQNWMAAVFVDLLVAYDTVSFAPFSFRGGENLLVWWEQF